MSFFFKHKASDPELENGIDDGTFVTVLVKGIPEVESEEHLNRRLTYLNIVRRVSSLRDPQLASIQRGPDCATSESSAPSDVSEWTLRGVLFQTAKYVLRKCAHARLHTSDLNRAFCECSSVWLRPVGLGSKGLNSAFDAYCLMVESKVEKMSERDCELNALVSTLDLIMTVVPPRELELHLESLKYESEECGTVAQLTEAILQKLGFQSDDSISKINPPPGICLISVLFAPFYEEISDRGVPYDS